MRLPVENLLPGPTGSIIKTVDSERLGHIGSGVTSGSSGVVRILHDCDLPSRTSRRLPSKLWTKCRLPGK